MKTTFCWRWSLEKLNPVNLWTWAHESRGWLLESLAFWGSCYMALVWIADEYKALGCFHWNAFHPLGFYIKLFEVRLQLLKTDGNV